VNVLRTFEEGKGNKGQGTQKQLEEKEKKREKGEVKS